MNNAVNNDKAIRLPAAMAAGVCLLSLLIAYFYMERYLLLEPCPLCILDRIAVALMCGGFFALAVTRHWHWRLAAWAYTTMALLAGWVFALRHIWLQNRPPDENLTCLSDNAAAQGLIEIIKQAFDAKADCGAIMWEPYGWTIPEQVLLLFFGLTLVQGWLLWQLVQRRRQEV
ncbi:MAG: disulfide bond formation protein B [Proteobacteria bacterium]|nr:disulfide bond formation protein B [Pseudomonadota bacterium]